jgi:hypothetical protein
MELYPSKLLFYEAKIVLSKGVTEAHFSKVTEEENMIGHLWKLTVS